MRPAALLLAVTLLLPGCLAEGPKPPAPAPDAGLPPITIDIGTGAHGLALVTPADAGYGYAEYINDLAGRAVIRQLAPGRYTYRNAGEDGAIAFRLLRPDPAAPSWLIAAFAPETKGDAPLYLFLHRDGRDLTLLPLSKGLFDAWQPATADGKASRARLAARVFTDTEATVHSAQDLRDLMRATRAFPKAYRVTYRLTTAPPKP